jgi:hypothetical protein
MTFKGGKTKGTKKNLPGKQKKEKKMFLLCFIVNVLYRYREQQNETIKPHFLPGECNVTLLREIVRREKSFKFLKNSAECMKTQNKLFKKPFDFISLKPKVFFKNFKGFP